MPLFLCHKKPNFKLLMEQKPSYMVGTRVMDPPPVYAEFENGQFYIEDTPENQDRISFIRSGPDIARGMIVEVPDEEFKKNMDLPPEEVKAKIEAEKAADQAPSYACRYCGQVCKSPQGLAAHMRKCTAKGDTNEPAPDNDPDASDGIDQPGPVRAEGSGS